mmetsp:Transcript_41074/g.132088  ORF Transcript_41074/g.132088 Transcript_41074/m.132088 type:complete len:180 (+) Transcript_41074:278-817(+)
MIAQSMLAALREVVLGPGHLHLARGGLAGGPGLLGRAHRARCVEVPQGRRERDLQLAARGGLGRRQLHRGAAGLHLGAPPTRHPTPPGATRVLLAGAWITGSFTWVQSGRILEFHPTPPDSTRVIRDQVEVFRNHRRTVTNAMIPNAFNGNHGSFDRTSMDLTSMEVADFAGASFEGHT